MITIDTKATGETTLFIAANSIIAAIHTLDRARAALVALDDIPQPEKVISPAAPNGPPQELIALRSEAIAAGNPLGQETALVAQEAAPPPSDLPLESDNLNAPDDTPPAALAEPTVEELQQEIATVGLRLFGEAWSEAHTWLVALWTKHHTPDNRRSTITQLDAAECTAILDGMITRSQDTLAYWRKHLAEVAAAEKAAAAVAPRRRSGRQPRSTASFTAPHREHSGRAPGSTQYETMANTPVYATA